MSGFAEFWRRYDEIEARLTAPVSARMIALAGLSPGMTVLDVACGRGEPAIPAAHRVGPGGHVLGIDRDASILELARERAAREGLGNLELRTGDAQEVELPEHRFDVATCRWALMYMDSPERALDRIRRALKPDGAFVAALWAEPERVPYATLGREVLARLTQVPPEYRAGSGVFRFAEEAVVRRTWESCGFEIEQIEELDIPVIEEPDGFGIATWMRGSSGGPTDRILSALPPAQQARWREEVAREAERYRVGDVVRLGGVTRLVLARPR